MALFETPLGKPPVAFSCESAKAPTAVLLSPSMLLNSAPAPTAVFSVAVLDRSTPAPTPVLNWPVLSLLSERKPTAVLKPPVVRLNRAACPSAVLPPGYPPSGGGLTAPALCGNAKQASCKTTSSEALLL